MQQHNTWEWVLVLNYIAFFLQSVFSFPELPFIAALTFFYIGSVYYFLSHWQ